MTLALNIADIELRIARSERDALVECIAEAHAALQLLPGVDENGPALVWLAEHLLHAHRRGERAPVPG